MKMQEGRKDTKAKADETKRRGERERARQGVQISRRVHGGGRGSVAVEKEGGGVDEA